MVQRLNKRLIIEISIVCGWVTICILLLVYLYNTFNYYFGDTYTTGDVLTANATPKIANESFAEIETLTKQAAQKRVVEATDSALYNYDEETDTSQEGQAQTLERPDNYNVLTGRQSHLGVVPEDLAAWLRVEGLDINDPVMQAKNNLFYLTHNELGENDRWGCYFFASDNNVLDLKTLDRKLIIFGHSNANATKLRFSTLKLFKDKTFATENQFIYVTINGETTKWQIFAESDYPIDATPLMNVNPNDENFKKEITLLRKLSYNNYTDVHIQYTDKVLYLITCSGDDDYTTRYIVAAKLVEM